MICSSCGKELKKGVAFCPSCGTKVIEGNSFSEKPKSKHQSEKTNNKKVAVGCVLLGITLVLVVSLIFSFIKEKNRNQTTKTQKISGGVEKTGISKKKTVEIKPFSEGVIIQNVVAKMKDGKATIIGETNLPDNTQLMVTFSIIELCINKGKVIVTTEDRTHRCKTRGVSGNSVFSERSFGATL